MKVIGSVQTGLYGQANILVGRYPHGGSIFVHLRCTDGEELATFSVNLVPYGAELRRDEFTVKNWGENEPFVDMMMATGMFEDTGREIPSGYVRAPVWRMIDAAHVPA